LRALRVVLAPSISTYLLAGEPVEFLLVLWRREKLWREFAQ